LFETARRDGRANVGCIVPARGADEAKVVHWLTTAASVPGFIGFAIGRTTFWDAVANYRAHTMTRQEASTHLVQRFREWAATFERPSPSRPGLDG
jgi:myo-inositol catabolism protein IolC